MENRKKETNEHNFINIKNKVINYKDECKFDQSNPKIDPNITYISNDSDESDEVYIMKEDLVKTDQTKTLNYSLAQNNDTDVNIGVNPVNNVQPNTFFTQENPEIPTEMPNQTVIQHTNMIRLRPIESLMKSPSPELSPDGNTLFSTSPRMQPVTWYLPPTSTPINITPPQYPLRINSPTKKKLNYTVVEAQSPHQSKRVQGSITLPSTPVGISQFTAQIPKSSSTARDCREFQNNDTDINIGANSVNNVQPNTLFTQENPEIPAEMPNQTVIQHTNMIRLRPIESLMKSPSPELSPAGNNLFSTSPSMQPVTWYLPPTSPPINVTPSQYPLRINSPKKRKLNYTVVEAQSPQQSKRGQGSITLPSTPVGISQFTTETPNSSSTARDCREFQNNDTDINIGANPVNNVQPNTFFTQENLEIYNQTVIQHTNMIRLRPIESLMKSPTPDLSPDGNNLFSTSPRMQPVTWYLPQTSPPINVTPFQCPLRINSPKTKKLNYTVVEAQSPQQSKRGQCSITLPSTPVGISQFTAQIANSSSTARDCQEFQNNDTDINIGANPVNNVQPNTFFTQENLEIHNQTVIQYTNIIRVRLIESLVKSPSPELSPAGNNLFSTSPSMQPVTWYLPPTSPPINITPSQYPLRINSPEKSKPNYTVIEAQSPQQSKRGQGSITLPVGISQFTAQAPNSSSTARDCREFQNKRESKLKRTEILKKVTDEHFCINTEEKKNDCKFDQRNPKIDPKIIYISSDSDESDDVDIIKGDLLKTDQIKTLNYSLAQNNDTDINIGANPVNNVQPNTFFTQENPEIPGEMPNQTVIQHTKMIKLRPIESLMKSPSPELSPDGNNLFSTSPRRQPVNWYLPPTSPPINITPPQYPLRINSPTEKKLNYTVVEAQSPQQSKRGQGSITLTSTPVEISQFIEQTPNSSSNNIKTVKSGVLVPSVEVQTPNSAFSRYPSQDIEGELRVKNIDKYSYYVVVLDDGGIINLSTEQLLNILSVNGGILPKRCKVPKIKLNRSNQ